MIELQADDRGPAGAGSPSNFYPIEGEVAGPPLSSGIEEANAAARERIGSMSGIQLTAVTGWTGKPEVFPHRWTAKSNRMDVVREERIGDPVLRHEAIAAPVTSVLRYLATECTAAM